MKNHNTFLLIFAAAMETSCAFTSGEHSSFGSKAVVANQGLRMSKHVNTNYFFGFASAGHRSVYKSSTSKQGTKGLDMSIHGNYEPNNAFQTQFREPQRLDIRDAIVMPETGTMVLASAQNAKEPATIQKKSIVTNKFDYFDYDTDFENRVGGLHDVDDWNANPPEGGLSDKIDWNPRYPAKYFTQ